ncbi:MAG TPA: hypothetical protein VGI13_06795 [Candidatus Acidoferrum sp.]|jgi:hypothetical protein
MADKKQQKQLMILGALVVVAALVWYFYVAHGTGNLGGVRAASNYIPINAQDFGKVFDQLRMAEATEYKPTGRNIFVAVPLPPPVDPNVKIEAPKHEAVGPQPPPPPPPAQLAMKFYGYGTLPSSGQRRAFLLDGEEVRIVGEGEVVQNHIRITHIGNDRIDFEDLNTGQRGSNALEMQPAA